MDKNDIINEFYMINRKLYEIYYEITAQVDSGEVFNFESNPNLADEAERLVDRAEKIRAIVFGESK